MQDVLFWSPRKHLGAIWEPSLFPVLTGIAEWALSGTHGWEPKAWWPFGYLSSLCWGELEMLLSEWQTSFSCYLCLYKNVGNVFWVLTCVWDSWFCSLQQQVSTLCFISATCLLPAPAQICSSWSSWEWKSSVWLFCQPCRRGGMSMGRNNDSGSPKTIASFCSQPGVLSWLSGILQSWLCCRGKKRKVDAWLCCRAKSSLQNKQNFSCLTFSRRCFLTAGRWL